ncbi:MAG: RNA polymerase sigma factor [Clostridia bacterium]|nr:RNA polymerase sigma factor [Clostridia bacterium]
MSSEKNSTVNIDIGALVKRSQLGDAESFGTLYELYADDMYRYALWYIGNETLAEEAVSEAVCNAFAAIRTVKKAQAFRGWLFRILSNCCKKYLTEKINARSVEPLPENDEIELEGDMSSRSELWLMIRRLDEVQRSILLLSVIGGYTSGEIGEMLHMKPSTVRSDLARTLHRLKSEISE